MSWTPPARPAWVERLNAHAEAVGGAERLVSLESQELLAVAVDSTGSAAAYCRWLIERDRKSTPLKSLQGMIWENGYKNGELRGHVYPDVPVAFARWKDQGKSISIFSSGSVLAQKLIFRHTEAGDLTPFITAHFDTTTGAKKEPESYRKIAAALGVPPGAVLFLSDSVAELDAARPVGMETALSARPENPPAEPNEHRVIRSFDEVFGTELPIAPMSA